MALQKNKALLLKGCLLMSLILSGCGGQALSEREIVRGVLFTKQEGKYSACLVLADQNADSASPEKNKISAARGTTPAQALERAEQALYGDVYYGLLDLAALPADIDLDTAREIGELLYDNAQPAPELSVFVLDTKPVQRWAEEATGLYRDMKDLETTYEVHCGLQQLFTQQDSCAIPGYRAGGGYDVVLLAEEGTTVRCSGMTSAQLAAVLSGQTHQFRGSYAGGQAFFAGRAQVTGEGNTLRLHLRQTEFSALTGHAAKEDLSVMLEQELKTSFQNLQGQMQQTGADPFHLKFWQACLYGPERRVGMPELQVLFE